MTKVETKHHFLHSDIGTTTNESIIISIITIIIIIIFIIIIIIIIIIISSSSDIITHSPKEKENLPQCARKNEVGAFYLMCLEEKCRKMMMNNDDETD